MALAALIAAYHESGEPGALRATLPIAGRSVIERQARLVAAAGASLIVIVVERMPASLTAAIDRLKRERVPVKVARSAEEAAEAIDPHDRVLLVADGAVLDSTQFARLAGSEDSAVLTVPDRSHGEFFERIDASSRWAGLAVVDGALLRETAVGLRDWDLQSTLLRRALQSGARQFAAEGPVAILDSAGDLEGLERQILAAATETGGGGWATRLLTPIERSATMLMMTAPAGSSSVGTAAAALTGFGALFFAYGWLWLALILTVLATPLEGIALRLARLRMQDDIERSWWAQLLPGLAAAGLAGLAYSLSDEQGWGMVLLALTTIAFLLALRIEIEGRKVRGGFLLAERRGMAWLLVPFAIFGAWTAGVAALFIYAAGSFFWAQREAHVSARARQD